VFDRFLSAAERTRLDRSRLWWARHRAAVESFRRGLEEPVAGGRARSRGRQGPRDRRSFPDSKEPNPPLRRRIPAASGPRAVLGVPEDASDAEIRRAFRRLAKRLHPDRAARVGLTPEVAAERFRAVREAYEALVR
jgi:DnaJ-domain-containing protein 1